MSPLSINLQNSPSTMDHMATFFPTAKASSFNPLIQLLQWHEGEKLSAAGAAAEGVRGSGPAFKWMPEKHQIKDTLNAHASTISPFRSSEILGRRKKCTYEQQSFLNSK